MDKLYPVFTLKNECHDCYKCVRECIIKAIKIQDGSASVIDNKCIACGHCVTVCPSNAKRIRYDIDKVKALLLTGKKVIVSLAPSWAGIYNISQAKMVAILKKLGFFAVSETALGAEEVSIKLSNWLKKQKKGVHISSACPVVVDYIRKYKSDFAKNITPFASPALTHAKLLKKLYGDDVAVVFIGPCIAKKNEADKHPELIDYSLTFEELNRWLSKDLVRFEEVKVTAEDKFVPEEAKEGALYPIEGGMNQTVELSKEVDDVLFMSLSGLKPLDNALNGLNVEKINKKIFIEALSCDTGCLNGPAKGSKASGVSMTAELLSKIKFREQIPLEPRVVVEENYKPEPVVATNYSPDEIACAMKRIGKQSEEDELNCGGCGYAT